MYAFGYACMYASMYACMYACMYASALFYAYACKYAGVGGYAHWLGGGSLLAITEGKLGVPCEGDGEQDNFFVIIFAINDIIRF